MEELLERQKGLHRTVLIVDDEIIEREMLGAMLSDTYEVLFAENGTSALETIRRESMRLSLIILDLHMPVMDGYSVLKIIRADNLLRRIPVIILTAEKEAEVTSLQLGAADFITKPYDVPDVIRARVLRCIELAEDRIILHETERDELTGLFNKEFFFQYGKRLDQQNPNMPMDALVFDINRFHVINELYGKAASDMILKEIGTRIHDLVCRDGGLACRLGNNCFGVYLPHIENLQDKLPQYITGICSSLGDCKISIRMGVYADEGKGLDMEQRFDRASLTCRKLRNSFSTCFDIYNEELHSKELFAERLLEEMEHALTEQQFKVFYQPKYDISGEKPRLSSAEALIRWYHPEFGVITPDVFIALFEEHGLIQKLDRYVWNTVAAQIRQWKAEYGIDLPVSVNVSRVDTFNPVLGQILSDITEKHGLENEKLLLEITESAYTENAKQIIDTVNGLREQGYKIEMDDFGSGYSSLNMLTALPIDALKLDMQFIRNISTNKKNFRLVGIMIEIARLLDVPVIAEGVETEEQMELLKTLGCDIIQGYYFSKPLSAEEFSALIRAEIGG